MLRIVERHGTHPLVKLHRFARHWMSRFSRCGIDLLAFRKIPGDTWVFRATFWRLPHSPRQLSSFRTCRAGRPVPMISESAAGRSPTGRGLEMSMVVPAHLESLGARGEQGAVLALNGGSSSIRFALYGGREPLLRKLTGKVDRVGLSGTTLTSTDAAGNVLECRPIDTADRRSAVVFFLSWLEKQPAFASVGAVGHRVVHGMAHSEPEPVTSELLDELRHIMPYDPEHLPLEIELIEAVRDRHPGLSQVACFDTAFHHTMPRVARLLPIPRRYAAAGVRRYGFHGLSYQFLMEELSRLGDAAATHGRVILAHLGNGASLAAVYNGRSIDTSMGFTPASGLVMGSRSGDVDPGLVSYLARTEHTDAAQFQTMTNHGSGLLGVSETSSDVRDLLAAEGDDIRAAEAVELFCYQAKKWIGAYAAALGGLDTLVFAGGIGENSSVVRQRICTGLSFLGIDLDEARNASGAPVISLYGRRLCVRVIRTDEELMIAKSVLRVITLGSHPSPVTEGR
jgi:acetate kinase